jgi:ribokinase
MLPPRIVVAGSLNYDLIAYVPHLPRPGEAVHALEMRPDLGGKGFNQAVAARRLGAEVEMVGAVGSDTFGEKFLERLAELGIGRRHVARLAGPTGLAVPVVADGGENFIVVGPGANLALHPDALDTATFTGADLLLVQGELRPETTLRAAQLARTANAQVILNAAPASHELTPLVPMADVVAVNQVEAGALGGPEGLLALGARAVVVTLGPDGAARYPGGWIQPAPRVDAVDTTGAGDAFCAALGVALAEGVALESAIAWAVAAGTAACLRQGTSTAMPDKAEVDRLRRTL